MKATQLAAMVFDSVLLEHAGNKSSDEVRARTIEVLLFAADLAVDACFSDVGGEHCKCSDVDVNTLYDEDEDD